MFCWPKKQKSDYTEQIVCSICFVNKIDTGFLHKDTVHFKYCRKCAQEWFQERNTCPECRKECEIVKVYT